MLLNHHPELVVYLNLSYNSFWNRYSPANKQLCNHLLDLLQFFEYYHKLLNYFLLVDQKRFFHHNIIIFYFFSWKIISVCNLFFVVHFQMKKWSVYLLLENLDQLRNTNVDLLFLLILFWYLFQLVNILNFICPLLYSSNIWRYITDFNCSKNFALSSVDKVTTRTQSFASVIENAVVWTTALLATITQLPDQFRSRVILQLIKRISRVLQKLLTYFNGTIISTFFVSLSPVWPVSLNESVTLASVKSVTSPLSTGSSFLQ